MENELINNNAVASNEEMVTTQYVDEFGNPIDPSLIDENGNYIGQQVVQYVDEFGNPIDPSLIDANGNYIGPQQQFDNQGNVIEQPAPVEESTTEVNSEEVEVEVPEIQVEQNEEPAIQIDSQESIQNVQPDSISQNVAASLDAVSNGTTLEQVNSVATAPLSASAHQMDNKELMEGMVTFDYNNVPITDIVNSIILDAINKGASDIHFDPFDDGIKIRIRIDGQLNDYSIVPLFVKKNMITRIKIISGMNITESRTPQDGAIRTELANKTIDLRVSCLPTSMGEKIVVRIMDYSMSASGVEALDFNEKNLEKVKKMLALPNGIILVTGATGSGKSTTVYSMLQKLNVEGTNLITVEDPIEMNIAGVNQVQAVSEIGLTFATVLRSILRQDPDVIMIGEIRDDETARIAVRAAITGHLVLSTIHTNNSLNTIERLTDMSVERYLLGTALSGIVSQKLARRLCPDCKRLRKTTDYEKEVFKKALNKDIEEIYEPVGCPHCAKGYRGRIAIQEVLLLNQHIKDAITKGVEKSILRELVYGENGTETMLEDGLEKVLAGYTSFDEILKLIDLEDDLGTGTQLGLSDQMEAATMNNPIQNQAITTPQINLGGNTPININISKELLESLNLGNFKQSSNEDDDDEVIIKPIKKKKHRVLKIDKDELKEMLLNDDDNEDEDESDEIETLDTHEEIEELPTLNNEVEETIESLPEEIEELPVLEPNEEIIELPEEVEELPVIEESKEEISNEDKLDDLYNKLLNTKNLINKKKFTLKVKSILNEIANLITDNTEIPTTISDYIELIVDTNKLNDKAKNDLIDSFNKTFNLSIQPIVTVDNDLIELEKDAIEIKDEDIDNVIDSIIEMYDDSSSIVNQAIDERLSSIKKEIQKDILINQYNIKNKAKIKEIDDTVNDSVDQIKKEINKQVDKMAAKEMKFEEKDDDDFTALDDETINRLLANLDDLEDEEETE